MNAPSWLQNLNLNMASWWTGRYAGAERIVVAGNASGVVATLSLMGTIIGSGGVPATDVFWVLVVFIGGLGAALLGRWAEAVLITRVDAPIGWLPLIRFALLWEALLLLVIGIVVGLVELRTFTR